jgi:hypothetical protein
MCELKPHDDRVMGLCYDGKAGYIYSCSTDKKFIVSEVNFHDQVTEVIKSSHGFTNLVYDKKNERIFLTNEVGVLYVYSTTHFPPTLLNSVQTSSKASIRGIHVDYKKFYIFLGSTNGKISVMELGLPGKERFIKEISYFDAKTKVI